MSEKISNTALTNNGERGQHPLLIEEVCSFRVWTDLTIDAAWVGGLGKGLNGICQLSWERSGLQLAPGGTEIGQCTQKLPLPLLTMVLALFLPTAVLGGLGGVGP